MHRTLERQIKRYLGEHAHLSPKFLAFLESVSRTYADYDEDRDLLNRSFDISSKEFQENNRYLEEIRQKVKAQAQQLVAEVALRTKQLDERVHELEDARRAMINLLEDFEFEQKALSEANAKDEALLLSIGEGVVAVDQDGRVIIMSKIAIELFGLMGEEVVGKPYFEILPLYDHFGNRVPNELRPVTMTLLHHVTSTSADYTVRQKSGAIIPVVITTNPVLLNGKLTGAIVVFRDVTKEKEIEKLRIDFLSLASHQLRTPLSGTKWLIETIQGGIIGPLNEKQQTYLNSLYRINERMIGLVSDMLNVLMLESGIQVMKKEKIAAQKIIEELLLMMEPASHTKGVKLRNAFKDTDPPLAIESDPQILRTILESLVGNAINYSHKGGEAVIDVHEKPDEIMFSVKDDGIGIPKSEQARISERFYRASNAKGFKPDGTGLGLYTAFLLAKKVGGKITFESEERTGTTFYLRVPKTLSLEGDNIKI